MQDLQDLELLVMMGTPLISIETIEEKRATELAQRVATRTGLEIYQWSVTRGLSPAGSRSGISGTHRPETVLRHIASTGTPGMFVLFDFDAWLEDAVVVRTLREIVKHHTENGHTLILVGGKLELPGDIEQLSAHFKLSLPGRDELEAIIHQESAAWGKKHKQRVQARSAVIDSLVNLLTGLTENHARRLVKRAIFDDGVLSEEDIPEVMRIKYQLLDTNSVLTYEFDHVDLEQVAGLRNLKEWLRLRRNVFLSNETLKGLDAPKGMLLLGVQGGGKSLAAKSVAGSWKVPLLRLDFGTLYNKYYGETERNLREALRSAETMAPCILWMDEIEKGLGSDDDGGPSKRVLGTLLTWMAEHKERVFLVATANDIESLPPELMRKGRFDEIFFVDLPGPEVRKKIFEIHLSSRDQNPAGFDLENLGATTEGFTGAEIEQTIVSALYRSHADNTALSTEHIQSAIASTQPLSVVMKEKVAYLRHWAKDRTVPAD